MHACKLSTKKKLVRGGKKPFTAISSHKYPLKSHYTILWGRIQNPPYSCFLTLLNPGEEIVKGSINLVHKIIDYIFLTGIGNQRYSCIKIVSCQHWNNQHLVFDYYGFILPVKRKRGKADWHLALSSEGFCDMASLLQLCYREMTSKISGKCVHQSLLFTKTLLAMPWKFGSRRTLRKGPNTLKIISDNSKIIFARLWLHYSALTVTFQSELQKKQFPLWFVMLKFGGFRALCEQLFLDLFFISRNLAL